MKLHARVSDPEILLRSLNEQGTAFYRRLRGSIVEAVYFSASKTIIFQGRMAGSQLEALRARAYEVKSLNVREQAGVVEVSQLE